MTFYDQVYNFPRNYKEGFLESEILTLLDSIKSQVGKTNRNLPKFNMDKFNNALFGITCPMIDGNLLIYPWDVEKAVRCGLENRDLTYLEWD
jgi:hypothetical protein